MTYTLPESRMAAAKKTPTAETTGASAALRVVSKSPLGQLRRAGMVFGAEPTVVLLAGLSEQQIAALLAEPLLDVTDTVVEPEAARF